MNKKETKEYINLFLPNVKQELCQANNRINTFITFYGLFTTLSISLMVFFWTKISDSNFFYFGVSITIITSLYNISKIYYGIRSLKPIQDIRHLTNNNEETNKDIDIYKFHEISTISEKSFLELFEYEPVKENALKQIYINSKITKERYKSANQLKSWKLFSRKSEWK